MTTIKEYEQAKDFRKLLKTTRKYIDILAEHGITNASELLLYFPRAYEDRRNIKTIAQLALEDTEPQTVKGEIVKKWMITTPRGKKLITIEFRDEEGSKGVIQALNNTYILKSTKLHQRYFIIGKPKWNGTIPAFWHPELIEAEETDQGVSINEKQENTVNTNAPHKEATWLFADKKKDTLSGTNNTWEDDGASEYFNFGRIYPIYAELQWIKPHWFAKKIFELYKQKDFTFPEYLPREFRQKYHLMEREEMIRSLHFPSSIEEAEQAKYRLFFEMLLKIQLNSLLNKAQYQQSLTIDEQPQRDIIKQIIGTLSFELTMAQKKVIKELIDDMYSGKTMMRLLQGDVGSGKTIVAVIVAYYVIKHFRGQVAFLVPIAVLAQQHYKNIAKILLPLWVRIEMITGSTTKKEKDRIKKWLISWDIDFIIGTHALIQDDIRFHNLSFALIDEQHKFGVKQRSFFQQHGSPHILQMTATPIPRSLALAFFGEFDVSIIDEMPSGRKPIITKILDETEFLKLKPWILTKIWQGQKVFLITPLIEESEVLDEVKAATTLYEEITWLYHEVSVGLLHGKMKASDKDEVMEKFKKGEYSLLVSTTVIEVGIDIPEATIMVIMNAERFWLSQLHQLRGRVGRSNIQSYCFLETKKKSGDTYQRLKHLENITDGFKLAEIDMQIRGTWEIMWVRQAWATDIPLSILSDTKFVERVSVAAREFLNIYPSSVNTLLSLDKDKKIMLV